MQFIARLRICLTVLCVSSLVAACGGGSSTSSTATAAASPGAESCTALSSKASSLPTGAAITSAVFVPATSTVAEHCNVVGTVNAGRAGAQSSPGVAQTYTIQWQVRMPTTWNSKLTVEGGGGLDGSVPDTTSRLSAGYMMAADNSGHDATLNADPQEGGPAAFGTDYQARVDFAYNAIAQTTAIARKLSSLYYGQAPKYSYFEGCSMGGREAMMVTQRLPDQFNGVVVGDPAFKLTQMSTHEVYNAQTFGALATRMGLTSASGLPLISNTFTDSDLQLVSKAVLDACDAKDGLVDGMINAPLQCTTAVVSPFLQSLACSGGKTASCLTADQINTLITVYSGPVTPSGLKPYYPWMWDAGIAGCTSSVDCNTSGATNIAGGWRLWTLGSFQTNLATATTNALDYSPFAGGGLSTVLAPTPSNAPAPMANEGLLRLMLSYNLDSYYQSIFATTPAFPTSSYSLFDVDSTDLSAFKNSGGKVLIWQPQTGGPFSPLAMVDWYQQLNQQNGGTPFNYSNVQKFARLFLMPGAQHCGGGPSTSQIDPFSAVVSWVENGTPPNQLIGTAPATTPWPGRTRPLCPFPQSAHYNGSGDINSASNFTCQ